MAIIQITKLNVQTIIEKIEVLNISEMQTGLKMNFQNYPRLLLVIIFVLFFGIY